MGSISYSTAARITTRELRSSPGKFAFVLLSVAIGVAALTGVRRRGELERGVVLLREADGWSLWSGACADAATTVRVPADVAWRCWTKGISEADARARTAIEGDPRLAAPLFGFVAVMA